MSLDGEAQDTELTMVFIGWENEVISMVPEKDASALMPPQPHPGFTNQCAEAIEARLKIQHATPEWHDLRITLMAMEF